MAVRLIERSSLAVLAFRDFRVWAIETSEAGDAFMFKVHADTIRNRLYLTLSGFFSAEESKACGDEAVVAIRKLKPGYDVVTDIAGFKPGTAEVAKDIERVQAHFKTTGARRGVRVVGSNAAGSMQFARLATQAGFTSCNVATLAEADKLLDEQ